MALGAIEPSSPFGVQGGRGWHFEPTATGYRLLDRDGQERVSLGLRRSEEDIYAIVKPWTFPRQTAPTLAAALELAKRIAMASLSLDPGAAAYQERCNDRKRIEAEERPRSKAAADYEASFKDEAARGCEFNIEEQTRLAGLLKEIPDDLAIPAFLGR